MITKLLEELNERIAQLNDICKSKDYFKDFEEKADLISKRIDKSSEKIEELEEENEKLKSQIKEYQKAVDETMSEKIDLENTIKEARERVNSLQVLYGMKPLQVFKDDLIQILDKVDKYEK